MSVPQVGQDPTEAGATESRGCWTGIGLPHDSYGHELHGSLDPVPHAANDEGQKGPNMQALTEAV